MSQPNGKPFSASANGAAAGASMADWMAIGLTVVWIGAVVAYLIKGPAEASIPSQLVTLLIAFLPLALIWVAVATQRALRALRAEAARLHATMESLKLAYAANQQANNAAHRPSVDKKLDETAASARQHEPASAVFSTRRDGTQSVASADRKAALMLPVSSSGDDQPALALGTPSDDLRPPLLVQDFIQALQFPEGPDDKSGFRALRLALEDRNTARLIRAAQDVLTLLSQEGIYMDDLKPDRTRPELWRKFAAGERGRGIAGLGGVRDRSSLALTAGRMREDVVFRDAGHHFLRTFDTCFSAFEKIATDADLAELSETRTARAFMLFGRVTGTFD